MVWIQMKFAAEIVLAAIMATAGTAVVVHRVLANTETPPQAATDPVISPTPPVTPASAPFTAQFSDGMKVELLGMNVNPSGKNPWWQPDGSPLARAPYRQSNGSVYGDVGKPYEFGVRLTGEPAGSDSSIAVFSAVSSWGPARGITAFAVIFPKDEPATIHLQYATQPWKKFLAVPAKDVFSTGATVDGVSFAPGTDPKDPAGITIVYSNVPAFFKGEWRLVALDGKNVVHHTTSMQTESNLLVRTCHIKFGKLKREDVSEYQIASRPYDRWVEFRNVSTQPGVLTDVEVQTSEDAAAKK
jgi:hypothetical protein